MPGPEPKMARTHWPTVEEQLAEAKALPGGTLERFIRANQDFTVLRPEEAHDNLGYPPWLRIYWRTANPEGRYAANDPSGGYPMSLHRVHTLLLKYPPETRGVCRLVQPFRTMLARRKARRNLCRMSP